MSDQQPDWDKITEGKIRLGIEVEAFSKDMELNEQNMRLMEKLVQFIIHGYDGIKDILEQASERKALSSEEVKKEIIDKFDGEVVKETDEDY